MIFKYDGSANSKKELRVILSEIKAKYGSINTLTVARMQGIQDGHKRLIDFHEEIGENNIIAIGSCQESGTIQNPFTASQRIEMIRMLKGYDKRSSGKLSIVKLNDINAVYPNEWKNYVLDKIANWSGNLPTPNVYIGGSELDIMDNGFHTDFFAISLERLSSGIMSGTEVRKSIVNGNDEWKNHVPYVIQDYMIQNFPKELTLEYKIKQGV